MPRLLDLFCGRGGWSNAFKAHGWECVGIDITDHGYTAGKLIQRSLPMPVSELLALRPDFVVASPPCEQFARHHLPWINGPAPDKTLLLWSVSLPASLRVRTIVECSRFAAWHVTGSSRCGSYQLWGDLPTLLPTPPRRKMKHSGTDPAARAMIEPELADWIAAYETQLILSRRR